MVDQLNGTLYPDGPADWLGAPNQKALAARSTRFKNCYTASPFCAPGRASFMSGLLPSRSRVYDNAAEFTSDIPTYPWDYQPLQKASERYMRNHMDLNTVEERVRFPRGV